MAGLDVLYYGCPFDLSGYGTVARNHLWELANVKGLNVRLRSKRFWQGVSPDLGDGADVLKRMERNPISESGFIFIQHLTPENFYIDPRAAYHVCYTPFETDGAPRSWLLPLRGMDEIWVPSVNNRDAYIRAGLNAKKIFVIRHGVDTRTYNPSVAPLDYPRGAYNFGSVFDWTERKNPTALVRAYYNAFHQGEDVTLSIRTFWRFPMEKTREYVSSMISSIKSGYTGRTEFPRIQFWFDMMDESIMPSFYKSFDCFVLPTRGEGFGLPFIEAMACGVPCIGPAVGGNREFMNESNSMLIDGKMEAITDSAFLRLQPQYAGQGWFNIDEVALSSKMRWAYDNKADVKVLASKGLSDIVSNFTWRMTADSIHNRLIDIGVVANSARGTKNDMSYMSEI